VNKQSCATSGSSVAVTSWYNCTFCSSRWGFPKLGVSWWIDHSSAL
jgi:hypothetical protein